MCMNPQGQAIYTALGRRNEKDGFTPNSQLGVGEKWQDRHPAYKDPSAASIPLGDGFLDVARTAILSRREKIRQAVEGT